MKMNILLMQTQFVSRNSKNCNIFALLRHQCHNDDAMHLSVNKISYSSRRLALTMNTQYNEWNMHTDKQELCSKLHKTP